jgi:Fe-S cluster biogenesis protein NfuA/nitrite reductase/ring-hydroxylating ferredoxin subunit
VADVGRVEALLERAQPDALELAQALVELYGDGLERIVELVAARDADGSLAAAFAEDELVAHLLLLHSLHPVPLEDRVRAALEEVRPYLDSHGGDVELLGIEDGVVRLRMDGSCSGCPSSTVTLKLAIEEAILARAPEVEEVRADEEASPLLHIETVRPRAASHPAWSTADGVPDVIDGAPMVQAVSGEPVLFVRLGERFYAYRPECPACGGMLEGAALEDTTLRCGCGSAYDVRHAGRGVDAPEVHLDPVPLLVDEDGRVRVAVGAAR